MYLLDMVINNSIGRLINADGYLAYRLGESFLTFIAETLAEKKFLSIFLLFIPHSILMKLRKRFSEWILKDLNPAGIIS